MVLGGEMREKVEVKKKETKKKRKKMFEEEEAIILSCAVQWRAGFLFYG